MLNSISFHLLLMFIVHIVVVVVVLCHFDDNFHIMRITWPWMMIKATTTEYNRSILICLFVNISLLFWYGACACVCVLRIVCSGINALKWGVLVMVQCRKSHFIWFLHSSCFICYSAGRGPLLLLIFLWILTIIEVLLDDLLWRLTISKSSICSLPSHINFYLHILSFPPLTSLSLTSSITPLSLNCPHCTFVLQQLF